MFCLGTRQRGLPSFLRETPLDAVVTKNVKRAANTIDRFSVRLGVFLRRYPIARLFVIAYMVRSIVLISDQWRVLE